MADLAKPKKTAESTNLLGKLILILPNLVFIVYLAALINQSESFALEKFEELRNVAYLIYTGGFIILGVYILIRKQTKLNSVIPGLLISLILTTFSYVLAKIAVDLIKLFNLF